MCSWPGMGTWLGGESYSTRGMEPCKQGKSLMRQADKDYPLHSSAQCEVRRGHGWGKGHWETTAVTPDHADHWRRAGKALGSPSVQILTRWARRGPGVGISKELPANAKGAGSLGRLKSHRSRPTFFKLWVVIGMGSWNQFSGSHVTLFFPTNKMKYQGTLQTVLVTLSFPSDIHIYTSNGLQYEMYVLL